MLEFFFNINKKRKLKKLGKTGGGGEQKEMIKWGNAVFGV